MVHGAFPPRLACYSGGDRAKIGQESLLPGFFQLVMQSILRALPRRRGGYEKPAAGSCRAYISPTSFQRIGMFDQTALHQRRQVAAERASIHAEAFREVGNTKTFLRAYDRGEHRELSNLEARFTERCIIGARDPPRQFAYLKTNAVPFGGSRHIQRGCCVQSIHDVYIHVTKSNVKSGWRISEPRKVQVSDRDPSPFDRYGPSTWTFHEAPE